jgi:hypothetical protein
VLRWDRRLLRRVRETALGRVLPWDRGRGRVLDRVRGKVGMVGREGRDMGVVVHRFDRVPGLDMVMMDRTEGWDRTQFVRIWEQQAPSLGGLVIDRPRFEIRMPDIRREMELETAFLDTPVLPVSRL